MKILLDSNNQAILQIVELCCQRAGVKLSDSSDADIIIKDLADDNDISLYDQNKTLFLISKTQSNEINAKFKIIKPFLPAQLIKTLLFLKDNHLAEIDFQTIKSEKLSQEIENLSQIVKEIDNLNDECNYSLDGLDEFQNNLDHNSIEDTSDDFIEEKNIENILEELNQINMSDSDFTDIFDESQSEKYVKSTNEFESKNIYEDSFSDAPIELEEILSEKCTDNKHTECGITDTVAIDEISIDDNFSKVINKSSNGDICLEDESKFDKDNTCDVYEPFSEIKKIDIDATPVAIMSFDKSFTKSQPEVVSKKEIKTAIKEGLQKSIAEFFADSQMKDVLKDMKIKIKISFKDK